MRVKLGDVYNAFMQLKDIVPQNRPLPQRGAYWLSRLYTKLGVEFSPIATRRDMLIISYDHKNEDGQPAVPQEKMGEFTIKLNELFSDEIDVEVTPVKIDWLILNENVPGAITSLEMVNLGPFVEA